MKRLLSAILLVGIGSGVVGRAHADEAAALAILDKGIKAIGGAEKLATAKIMSWKAKGTFSFGENENPIDGEVLVKGITHFRSSIDGEFNGNAFKAITIVNGEKGWRKFADNLMELDGDGLASEKRNTYLMVAPVTLVQLKEKAFKLDTAGEEKVGEKPAVGIKVVGPDGKDFKIFFDKESGLPVKMVATVLGFQGDEFSMERYYSAYKDFGGIKRATKVVAKRDGDKFIDEEISDFKILDKVPADAFDEPK
jgi:hypothetical protein